MWKKTFLYHTQCVRSSKSGKPCGHSSEKYKALMKHILFHTSFVLRLCFCTEGTILHKIGSCVPCEPTKWHYPPETMHISKQSSPLEKCSEEYVLMVSGEINMNSGRVEVPNLSVTVKHLHRSFSFKLIIKVWNQIVTSVQQFQVNKGPPTEKQECKKLKI